MAFPIALIGVAKVAGAFLAKVGIVAAATTAVAVGATALADSPLGKPVVGAVKSVGKTVGKAAKGVWRTAKKIPVLGKVFRGIENLPHAFWSTAKKTPVIGRLCNISEEMFYGFKARFNKGFTELRAIIAKIMAKIVELIFKAMKNLDKETKANGDKAIDRIKKEKKAVSKAAKRDRGAPSAERTQAITRNAPENAKTTVRGERSVVPAAKVTAKEGRPAVTTDIVGKINSAKGMAVPGSVAPVIAAGKELAQKPLEKAARR